MRAKRPRPGPPCGGRAATSGCQDRPNSASRRREALEHLARAGQHGDVVRTSRRGAPGGAPQDAVVPEEERAPVASGWGRRTNGTSSTRANPSATSGGSTRAGGGTGPGARRHPGPGGHAASSRPGPAGGRTREHAGHHVDLRVLQARREPDAAYGDAVGPGGLDHGVARRARSVGVVEHDPRPARGQVPGQDGQQVGQAAARFVAVQSLVAARRPGRRRACSCPRRAGPSPGRRRRSRPAADGGARAGRAGGAPRGIAGRGGHDRRRSGAARPHGRATRLSPAGSGPATGRSRRRGRAARPARPPRAWRRAASATTRSTGSLREAARAGLAAERTVGQEDDPLRRQNSASAAADRILAARGSARPGRPRSARCAAPPGSGPASRCRGRSRRPAPRAAARRARARWSRAASADRARGAGRGRCARRRERAGSRRTRRQVARPAVVTQRPPGRVRPPLVATRTARGVAGPGGERARDQALVVARLAASRQ